VVLVLSGKLESYIGPLVPAICFALSDPKTTSPLKLEGLSFLEQLLVLHSPELFKDHYSKLSSAVFVCVQDRFYKVISSSLRVCGEFVKIVQTFMNNSSMQEFEKYLGELYRNIQDRLQLKDIDKDVKEAAIEAMGILVSRLGRSLKKSEQNPLPTLLEKLCGEVTRLTACKTFALIAASPDHLDMSSSFLKEVLTEMAGYLRKNMRPLRLAAVLTLTEFVKGYGKEIDGKLYSLLISEIQGLLSVTRDMDLHLTQLALDLVVRILEVSPKSSGEIRDQIMPAALQLLETPTLQGSALMSLSSLLRQMLPTVGFADQLSAFLGVSQRLKSPITKQVYTNIGKCIAVLVQSPDSSQQEVKKTIEKFASDIKRNSQQDEGMRLLALYTLGEIGLVHGLLSTYYGSLKGDLESCFESPSDEVKAAASTCLGNVAVGNLEQYLPSVLQGIGDDKKKYLLLHSLKEIIAQAPAEEISKYITGILPLLFENCDKAEEGIRNVVSECLGKLACVDYGKVMGELKTRLDNSSNEQFVSTIVSSVRYTITEKTRPFDAQLKQDIAKFLSKFLINSSRNGMNNQQHHHKVRRACILLLTSVLHTKPTLILSNLSSFLPDLYAGCVVDKSLIKNIDMGPFKVEQDDGLELRKSVYECMDTLLDVAIKSIDANKFAVQLPLGLSDPNSDIKMLTHIMIQKLCESVPSAVLHIADSMVDPLKVTLTERPKENAVPTEKEKVVDQIRSAMKAVVAISLVKGIQDSVKFNDLLAKVVKPSPTLETLFETILLNNNSIGSGIGSSNINISGSK